MSMAMRSTIFPGLPIINNLHDLSNKTHLSRGLLYKLSTRHDYYYKVFTIPKPSGGVREIAEPAQSMKAIQSWILTNILQQLPLSPQVTGFRKNYNILDNASAHEKNKYLLCLDIDDFFPSINYPLIYTLYRRLGYNEHVSHILTSMCTFKDRLPQGGITSPTLSNLACYRLDRRISGYCGTRNITYTRYADDMAFSSMSWERLIGLKAMVQRIVQEEGLALNEAKTRYMGPKRRQKITGLVIGDNHAGIGRHTERRLRAIAYNMCAPDKSVDIEDVEVWFKGYLSFLHSIDKVRYERITDYISRLALRFPSSKIDEKLRMK